MLANDVVNSEGVVFVSRLVAQTGATPAEVVAAYRTARDVSGAVERWEAIEGLFGKIGMEPWIRLMQLSDRAVAALTRWYLARLGSHSIGEVVAAHRPGFDTIGRVALEVGPAEWRRNRAEFMKRYEAEGVPTDLARRQAVLPVVVYGADVIQVAEGFGHEVEDALDVFLRIGRALGLDRLTEAARSIDPGARWQRWALWTVEEELLAVRRRAAERVLEVSEGRTGEEAVEHFLTERSEHVGRLVRFMEAFHADPGADVAPLMVALRQVRAALS
jgi:glutamate dehydrogenase